MAKMSNGKNIFSTRDLWTRCESGYYFLIILLVALSFWVAAKFLNEVKSFTRPSLSSPTILVTGEGKVLAKPDVGVVNFSMVSSSLDMAFARDGVNEQADKIISFLKSSGVEDKDIKTTAYNISPQYDYPKGRREFLGYEVRQTLQVKIRDLEKIDMVVGGITEFGAIEIGDLRFVVDNDEVLKQEARAAAIADAKTKALVLSKSLGVRLGDIVSFSEFGGPVPFYGYAASLGVGGDFERSIAPSIPTGENEIVSNVNISFEIR